MYPRWFPSKVGFGGDPGVLQNQYLQVFCWVWCSIEMINLQNSRRSFFTNWHHLVVIRVLDGPTKITANGAKNKKGTWSVQGVLTCHEGTNMCFLLKICVICVCVSTRHFGVRRYPQQTCGEVNHFWTSILWRRVIRKDNKLHGHNHIFPYYIAIGWQKLPWKHKCPGKKYVWLSFHYPQFPSFWNIQRGVQFVFFCFLLNRRRILKKKVGPISLSCSDFERS